MTLIRANYDYKGTTDKELSFTKYQEFELVDDRNPDWWLVQHGNLRGYVPSNYVSMIPNRDNLKVEDVGLKSESESDLSEYHDEGEESESEEEEEEDQVQELLSNLKRNQSQSHRAVTLSTPDSNTLQGFTVMPLGFRCSTLGTSLTNGIGLASKHLIPELNSHGLGFKDLHLENKTKVRKRKVKLNLLLTISAAHDIPLPQGLIILGRAVNLALMDNQTMVSNIHTVPAICENGEWHFNEKSSIFRANNDNKLFLRANSTSTKLYLLFELCLYARNPTTQQIVRLSCGWSTLSIYTAGGLVLESKNYKLQMFGGTPFENNVSLATSPIRNQFWTIMSPIAPRLEVKIRRTSSRMQRNLEYIVFNT